MRTRRICGSRFSLGLNALAIAVLSFPGQAHGQTADYLDYDDLTRELRSLADGSDLATLRSLGTTLGRREVWMVEVGIPSGPEMDHRPGALVVGNLEGNHLVGSQLALEALRYLIANRADDSVRAVLDTKVFYFIPRLNPDGAEAMFASLKGDRRTNALPWDEDNDGRVDEDGPEDLNGDGRFTVMRVPDPSGPYMIDPDDPRIMKKADVTKGESGSFKIYWEGTDEDGDGFINEDGPGGVDLNRNFQHAYPYWEGDAGPHMVSEIETRALMDFVLAHRNIATILTFGQTDNLVTPPNSRGELAAAEVLDLPLFAKASNDEVFSTGVFSSGAGPTRGRGGGGFGGRGGGGGWLRGAQPGRDNDPSSGTRPATTVAGADQVYFTAVSKAYKDIAGIETVPVHRAPGGAFFQYGYFHFGVPSFTTPGWGLPAPDSAKGTGDAKALAALEAADIEAFADWTPFQHPELGDVEIGGFVPYVTQNPPAGQLPDLGEKHGRFLVKLAGMLAQVRIAEVEVEAHGGGVFKVTAEVENTGFFPTSTQHGVRSRSVGPTYAQIQVEPDDMLTGADKTASVGVLNGSGTREEVVWIIRGQPGTEVEIRLMSQKSGHDSRTVTLR